MNLSQVKKTLSQSTVHILPKTPTHYKTLTNTHIRQAHKCNRQSDPKRRHIKFRRRGITQRKACNVQNTTKV